MAARIRELMQTLPREEVAFKIAEEVVYGRFGHEGEAAADQAIRTGLSILDEGVTVAPIQGIVRVVTKVNPDRSTYLAVYFAGPIRSAGGTEMAMILVLAEFVRQLLGLDRYKASKEEAKRFVEELRLYEREVARFQYRLSDDELYNAVLNLPVEATGVETDRVEVTTFRNLGRIETNCVRGGALRVVNDGLIGRSNKVLKLVEKLGIPGWGWLKDIRPHASDSEDARQFMFMEEVIAGRPIFCFPSAKGGFRLRYGRCRNTGLASVGVHPATMEVLHNFIAAGTQLRLEKPGKAGIVSPVETIEPPVVELVDRSVLRIEDLDQAKRVRNSIRRILFLGDILVGFGEFIENNKPLAPSGYTEEWWGEDLRVALGRPGLSFREVAARARISEDTLLSFVRTPLISKPSAAQSLALARALEIPLHPRFTYFWENLSIDEFVELRAALRQAELELSDNVVASIHLQDAPKPKELLEEICISHRLAGSQVVVEGDDALVLWECLNPLGDTPQLAGTNVFDAIKCLSGVVLRQKGGTYIGTRMGRPEKAKKREMKPLVHSLFPVGLSGGARRNIVEAARTRKVVITEIANRRCGSCGKELFSNHCEECGKPAVLVDSCPICQRELDQATCPSCNTAAVRFSRRVIDPGELFGKAVRRLGLAQVPELVKGIRGLTNENKIPEPLEKGILRAVYDLSLFKDGTMRFDATNAVLTHFQPREVGASVERLRSLGYQHDQDSNPLVSEDQILPLRVQDVIVPKKCGDYLVKVSRFMDDLLRRFYNLPSYYNLKAREDLIGQLVIGLSPHTSVGVLGRIVGFTENNVCYAHPFWHAAKRRDCDGDEDSISLLLDVLLNFSRSFLPGKIGGMMDAPLLITSTVNPAEVARQAFNIETVWSLPLRFFEETQLKSDAKKVSDLIEMIYHRLCTPVELEQVGYTHNIGDINTGNRESSYTKFASMFEKVTEQLNLSEAIKAVEANEVAQRVVSTHFLRDLVGNLKAYSSQKVRCKKCNTKYRRIPLSKKCSKCGGELSLTVFKGTIEKYLDVARQLIQRYDLGLYYQQRIELIDSEIKRLFNAKSGAAQKALAEFM